MSHKLQSELGVIGEMSPNAVMLNEITNKLHDTFDHTHGTITDEDCYLIASACRIGHTVNGQGKIVLEFSRKGCDEDILDLLTKLLVKDDRMMQIVSMAIVRAIMERDQE
jgi:hypothetical protein